MSEQSKPKPRIVKIDPDVPGASIAILVTGASLPQQATDVTSPLAVSGGSLPCPRTPGSSVGMLRYPRYRLKDRDVGRVVRPTAERVG